MKENNQLTITPWSDSMYWRWY